MSEPEVMHAGQGAPAVVDRRVYRFIVIEQRGSEVFSGRPVYRIFNRRSGAQLGILSYYSPWKEYVFSSREDCVFNRSCLLDVLNFLDRVARVS